MAFLMSLEENKILDVGNNQFFIDSNSSDLATNKISFLDFYILPD